MRSDSKVNNFENSELKRYLDRWVAQKLSEKEHTMTFDVHVVNSEGERVYGARVRLSFTNILRGMTAEERTDSDGHAEFSDYEDGEVQVFVNGRNYGTYYYSEGDGITITI